MVVEKNAPLQPCNTFGIAARAQTLVRVHSVQNVRALSAPWRASTWTSGPVVRDLRAATADLPPGSPVAAVEVP